MEADFARWSSNPTTTVNRRRVIVWKYVRGGQTAILYLLFVNYYQSLNLKPNPVTDADTPQLWNWDVSEAFIGSDFSNIKRYKEFQVSPQGEWIDLGY